jgi:TPR repeat protein
LSILPLAPSTQDYSKGFAAFTVSDYEAALQEWRPLAKQSHAAAQGSLGAMYESGDGAPQDYAEAAKWNLLAAEKGHAFAQTNLGLMYLSGKGVPKDFILAHMWLNIASANGPADAGERRDRQACTITPDALSDARDRARACMRSNYQDCD